MYLLPLVLVIALDHQMIEQHRQVKAELWNQIMGPESIEWEKLRACRKLGQADRKLVAAEHALWYGSIEEFWRLQRSFELSFTAATAPESRHFDHN